MPNLWGLFGMYWMKLTLHRVPIICSSTAMCSLGILWVKQLSSTAVRTGRTLCSLSYAGSVQALADMLSEQWKYQTICVNRSRGITDLYQGISRAGSLDQ